MTPPAAAAPARVRVRPDPGAAGRGVRAPGPYRPSSRVSDVVVLLGTVEVRSKIGCTPLR